MHFRSSRKFPAASQSRHPGSPGFQAPSRAPGVPTRRPSANTIQMLIDRLAPYSFWLAILAAFTGLFLIVASVLGFFAYYQVTDRINPGVHVGGLDIGGKTVADAAVEIHQKFNLDRQILLDDGLQPRQVSPAVLGISVDSVASAQAAFDTGHRKDLFFRLGALFTSLSQGESLPLVIQFDEGLAQQTLAGISNQLTVAPQDARIALQGDQLVALPASLGYTLNLDETLAPLRQSPETILRTGYLKLVLLPLSPAVSDATPQLQAAQAFLENPHRMQAFDPIRNETISWDLERNLVGSWLAVSNQEGQVRLDLSTPAIEAYLAGLSAQITDGRRLEPAMESHQVAAALLAGQTASIRLFHNPTTYTIQSGDTLLRIAWQVGMPYWIIAQANPGIDINHLTLGQTLTIPSLDDLLPLPIVPNKRIVMSISNQRMEVFENGEKLHKFIISTGIDRSPTQPGVFQVRTHELSAYASVWDLTMPHFLGIYEAWPGFMNGIHGLPTLSNGRRLWANILGKPASYGCIILDLNNAEWLYNWADEGVIVEITR